eukprot:9494746-Pyramimonas_sp.AAC.1
MVSEVVSRTVSSIASRMVPTRFPAQSPAWFAAFLPETNRTVPRSRSEAELRLPGSSQDPHHKLVAGLSLAESQNEIGGAPQDPKESFGHPSSILRASFGDPPGTPVGCQEPSGTLRPPKGSTGIHLDVAGISRHPQDPLRNLKESIRSPQILSGSPKNLAETLTHPQLPSGFPGFLRFPYGYV